MYNIYKRHPAVLDDEPKHTDIKQLMQCPVKSTRARASILEFTGILQSKSDGFTRPGDESKFDIEDESGQDALSDVVDNGEESKLWCMDSTHLKITRD